MTRKFLIIIKLLGIIAVLGSFLIIALDISSRPTSNISVSQLPLFFTNQSNALASLFFLLTCSKGGSRWMDRALYETMRGGLIIYLFLASSVHWVLLSPLLQLDSLSMHGAIAFLHGGCFIILLLDWLLDPPQYDLPPRFVFTWLAYPVLYLFLMTFYGLLSQWYPYPFINPEFLGFPKWAMINGLIALIMGALSLGFIKLNSLRLTNARNLESGKNH
jgi:hypothetical protein